MNALHDVAQGVAVLVVAITSLWVPLGLLATAVVRARRAKHLSLGRAASPVPHAAVPVSVLKPLAGADGDLERNLESMFRQDHERFELIFGTTRVDDPALAVVQRLAARHRHVSVKIIVHAGSGRMNPKVDNLLGMLEHAAYDVVLISDSNVRAPAHYVREAAALITDGGTLAPRGLVTHLFAGVGEDGLGSALENVQLAGFCAAGTALPTLLGDALVVGKSMMFSRSELDALGGLGRVADVLAEDWLLGKTYEHAGSPIRLAPTVLENVTTGTTVAGFFERQLRWAMLRSRLRPLVRALEILTSPLAVMPLAMALFGVTGGLMWAAGLLALRDTGGWIALRGLGRVYIPLVLSPLRELFMLVVWLRAPFKRHLVWRGNRVRVGAGTYAFRARPRRERRLRRA